ATTAAGCCTQSLQTNGHIRTDKEALFPRNDRFDPASNSLPSAAGRLSIGERSQAIAPPDSPFQKARRRWPPRPRHLGTRHAKSPPRAAEPIEDPVGCLPASRAPPACPGRPPPP